MKSINTLFLASCLGMGTICHAGLPAPVVTGGAGAAVGNTGMGTTLNGSAGGSLNQALPGNGSVNANSMNSFSTDQNTSPHSATMNGSMNGQASGNVNLPQHQEVQDVIATVQAKRQQYEEQQKQLLDQLQTTSGEQRDFIRERLKNNREAFQSDIKQLRQELLDEAKALQKATRTDIDAQIDHSK